MVLKCWKCKAGIDSKRAKYCPACGIVEPCEGNRKIAEFKADRDRIKKHYTIEVPSGLVQFVGLGVYSGMAVVTVLPIVGLAGYLHLRLSPLVFYIAAGLYIIFLLPPK